MRGFSVKLMEVLTPWLKNYGDVPFNIDYPNLSISEMVLSSARKCEKRTSLVYMNKRFSGKQLIDNIELHAKAYRALGVKKGDIVTLVMPNTPQAIYSIYALNQIGAVVSLIHPLSAINEIKYCLNMTKSNFVLTLDQFVYKFDGIMAENPELKIVVSNACDELSAVKRKLFKVIAKIPKIKYTDRVIAFKEFLRLGRDFLGEYREKVDVSDPAIILFSGGTTGTTKGIELSNMNINSCAIQTAVMNKFEVRHKTILAAMPIFHGFGLGVCIHTALINEAASILMPKFNVKEYSLIIRKQKPNYIAGVPTLYEAMIRSDYFKNADLSFLMGVFSGGDSLSVPLARRINAFLKEHKANIFVREGYGTTESVTACCLTPYHTFKEGCIGFPFPDTYFKICIPGTTESVGCLEDGEICISGPSVMLRYMNSEEETKETLKTHDDGRVWLHTGDLGSMDEDGYIYFKQRIKRMIVSSGYNIYPSQIENVLDAHEAVHQSCAVGVKDEYKVQKVKAFVVLKNGFEPSEELKKSIFSHLKLNIAKYAMPYDIEILKELPRTKVGKVAYRELEDLENSRS